MDVELKKITHKDIDDFKLIQKWNNDNSIKYLLRPNFKEGEIEDITLEELIEGTRINEYKHTYMIVEDDKKVGFVTIDTNFKMLFNENDDTAWISICVGDNKCRGKGIGIKAMKLLEDKVMKLGKNKIELGVFEYNTKAINFYEKNGYKAIGKSENFVYYNGNWYSDIRMEKQINL